jgi:hypothetical protein
VEKVLIVERVFCWTWVSGSVNDPFPSLNQRTSWRVRRNGIFFSKVRVFIVDGSESGIEVEALITPKPQRRKDYGPAATEEMARRAHLEYVDLILEDQIAGPEYHQFIWRAQLAFGDEGAKLARQFCRFFAAVRCPGLIS